MLMTTPTTPRTRSVGARLFTATDVERAARLAAQHACHSWHEWGGLADPSPAEVEAAVQAATLAITEDAPLFYSEHEVRSMLQYTLSKEDVDAELAEALQAIGR